MVTAEELRLKFTYHPETGVFTRNQAKGVKPAGSEVGTFVSDQCGNRYMTLWINGKNVKLHRLAWIYMTGSQPPQHIDHINGDGTDNRWKNLRSVSNAENNKNKRISRVNKSGVCGVALHKRDQVWTASIRVNGKLIHLGTFADKLDAISARRKAERDYEFHENHGARRLELVH